MLGGNRSICTSIIVVVETEISVTIRDSLMHTQSWIWHIKVHPNTFRCSPLHLWHGRGNWKHSWLKKKVGSFNVHMKNCFLLQKTPITGTNKVNLNVILTAQSHPVIRLLTLWCQKTTLIHMQYGTQKTTRHLVAGQEHEKSWVAISVWVFCRGQWTLTFGTKLLIHLYYTTLLLL